jgi:hypothetical protein
MFTDYNKVAEKVKMPLPQNSQVFSGCKCQTKKRETMQKNGAAKYHIFPILLDAQVIRRTP